MSADVRASVRAASPIARVRAGAAAALAALPTTLGVALASDVSPGVALVASIVGGFVVGKALETGEVPEDLHALRCWSVGAKELLADSNGFEQLDALTRATSVRQLEHVMSDPVVRETVAQGELTVSAWLYDVERARCSRAARTRGGTRCWAAMQPTRAQAWWR
jgi:hypothetical protein